MVNILDHDALCSSFHLTNKYPANSFYYISLGVTHSLSVRLVSKDALKVYQDHPMHVKVKDELIVPILAGPPSAIDYESEIAVGEDVSKQVE